MIMDPSTELLQLDGNNGNTVSYANLQLIPQSYQGTYNIPVTLNAYPLNIPIQTVSYSAYSTTLYPQESTVNVIQVSEPIFTASYEPKYDDLAKSPSSSITYRSSPEYHDDAQSSSPPQNERTSSQSPKSPMDDQPKRKNLGTLTPEEKREYRRAQNRIDQRRRAEKVKSRADSLRNKARQKHKAIEQKISQVDQHIEHLQRYLKEIPSIQEKNLLIFKELSSTTPITKSEKATIMENTQKIDSIIEKISVMEAKEEKPKFSENNDDIASEISFTPARYVKTDELMKMPAWKRCRVRRQMEEQKLENACDQLDKKCEKIDKVIQAYEAKIYLLLKESVSALRQIAQIISRLRNRAQIPETRAKTLDYDLDDMTKTIDVLETHAQLRASTTKSMADCLLPLQI